MATKPKGKEKVYDKIDIVFRIIFVSACIIGGLYALFMGKTDIFKGVGIGCLFGGIFLGIYYNHNYHHDKIHTLKDLAEEEQ